MKNKSCWLVECWSEFFSECESYIFKSEAKARAFFEKEKQDLLDTYTDGHLPQDDYERGECTVGKDSVWFSANMTGYVDCGARISEMDYHDDGCKHDSIYHKAGEFFCCKCNFKFEEVPAGYDCSDIPGVFNKKEAL